MLSSRLVPGLDRTSVELLCGPYVDMSNAEKWVLSGDAFSSNPVKAYRYFPSSGDALAAIVVRGWVWAPL
jgi:hypothetical protein